MVLVTGTAVVEGRVVRDVVVVDVDVDVGVDVDGAGAAGAEVVGRATGSRHAVPAKAVRPHAERRAARHTPSTRTALATTG